LRFEKLISQKGKSKKKEKKKKPPGKTREKRVCRTVRGCVARRG